jgi:hypothetical protein
MSKPKTDAASSEVKGGSAELSNNPELLKLEQAVKAEAGTAKSPETSSEEKEVLEAPEHGQAFQELSEKKGFKSVDELVRAYQTTEGYSTQLSQEMKELREEIKQSNAPQSEDPYGDLPQEQKQALDLLRNVVNEEIQKSISPIKEDFEVKKASEQLNAIRDSFKGVSDADLDAAISRKESIPGLSLEEAVKIVTYEAARSDGTTQRKRAAKTKQKNRAYVESGKTSKTGGDIDYSKLSLEELESILPKAGQFIDHKGILQK